jgi:hypothetical protein
VRALCVARLWGTLCAMRSSRRARGTPGRVGLLLALGMGCSASDEQPRVEDGHEHAGAGAGTTSMMAPRDAGTDPRTAPARDAATPAASTAPGGTGEPDSGPPSSSGDAAQAGQSGSAASDAALPMAGSGGAPACEADCSPADALQPQLLDVWHFDWQGGNPSFFQIGLCGDGVATYVFADAPNDPNALRVTGRYVADGPDRLIADFMGVQPQSGDALHFDLVYDAPHDRMHRTPNDDGYSDYGARLYHFPWAQPAATCPTP